ncbi:GIY-YIG nuclease family protein [bacterium]|nr:GIY-YIG nuclease family protein [bacterium]
MTDARPFKIQIFVAEGMPDGLRIVEKSNWIGQGIICPRGRWPHVKGRAEFDKSGVYILRGRDGASDRPTVYVGEAETVRSRLNSHHANKDFWSQAIVFTRKADPLNKAEVQFLEARLVEIAKTHKRCSLDNGNTPNRPGLSDADEAEIEGYLDEMLKLLPLLGVHAFEAAGVKQRGQRTFTFSGRGWEASGYEANDGFVVKAGSLASRDTRPSCNPGRRRLRETLVEEGVLEVEPDGLRFTVDFQFSAPSAAATIVAGGNTNGRTAWKDSSGITLKEHQEREAAG